MPTDIRQHITREVILMEACQPRKQTQHHVIVRHLDQNGNRMLFAFNRGPEGFLQLTFVVVMTT
jgi:hypothetical protein